MVNRLLGVISALPEELAHLSDRSAEVTAIGGLPFWRGRIAGRVGSLWPLALVPFAGFIAIASDPEVWPMGTVPPLMASPERRHSRAGRE